ncbi:WYL domain-containing protein [Wenyingzhuangia sp. 1_MG-2023]|nr:WYL domain-containing protein [Wenyingzhuangia sp. 1_MG-2023]
MNALKRKMLLIDSLKEQDLDNKEIKNLLLRKGFKFSSSCLSRDIDELIEMGFPIIKPKKGIYSLATTDEQQYHIIRFFKHYHESEVFRKLIKRNSSELYSIRTDSSSIYIDYEIFNQIHNAILEKKIISFIYKSYLNELNPKEYTLSPLLLKEFKNRWYVIGTSDKKLKTFSIDRIHKIAISGNTFKYNLELIDEKIQHTYGISITDKKPVLIKLKVSNSQLRYVESVPIQANQKITPINEDYFLLELFLTPTIELKQELLKYGSWIEVLAPKSLRTWFTSELEKALKNYK